MRIAITGAHGFVGWHTRCALKAHSIHDVIEIDRDLMSDPMRLSAAIRNVDAILHLAGVNRADPDVLRDENLSIARRLTSSLDHSQTLPVVVFGNSIQSGNGTPFGDGKQAAAEHLFKWGEASGAPIVNLVLPNLFGEHGRPNYNSVVATFCHDLVQGREPTNHQDREVPLLHVQDAVEWMTSLIGTDHSMTLSPSGRLTTVTSLLELLYEFRDFYSSGEIPSLVDPFHLSLFNTFRSFCFPTRFPIQPPPRTDPRGTLFECLRSHGGESQVFCSTTNPGFTRGDHFHLRKVERFLVLRGTAEISLRRLFDDTVHRFKVTGQTPAMVDMPTMWAHSITNTGNEELVTMFWAHELFDPEMSDTFPERVELAGIDQ